MRIVNHTPREIAVRTVEGGVVVLPRGPLATVKTRYARVGEASTPSQADPTRTAAVELRVPAWHGMTGLPDPEPGVLRVVTTHVAERAALSGRRVDDLLVALQAPRGGRGGGAAYLSLCPASHASPALRALAEGSVMRAGVPRGA